MTTLILDDDLVTNLTEAAKTEQKPLSQLLKELLDLYLEEKFEAALIIEADKTLERIRNGEEKVFTLNEVKERLYEMDCSGR